MDLGVFDYGQISPVAERIAVLRENFAVMSETRSPQESAGTPKRTQVSGCWVCSERVFVKGSGGNF